MKKRILPAAPVPERPIWIKASSVGRYVEIGVTKLYEILGRGLVKSSRIGGSPRKAGTRLINLPDLERYIAEHAEGGVTEETKSATASVNQAISARPAS
jgi:hypothetical protein